MTVNDIYQKNKFQLFLTEKQIVALFAARKINTKAFLKFNICLRFLLRKNFDNIFFGVC